MKFIFKLDHKREYKTILKAPYVIKLNDSPQKGLLIDTYMPLPNPFFINRLYTGKETIIIDPKLFLYRALTARHWPKAVHEDHMQILLPYGIPYRELMFRGQRDFPPGNFKIVEQGSMQIISMLIQNYFFVYIITMQPKLSLIANIGRGATYALYLDRSKMFDMSTIAIKNWNISPIYLRLQKIYQGIPKNITDHENYKMLNKTNLVPYFFKRLSSNSLNLITNEQSHY